MNLFKRIAALFLTVVLIAGLLPVRTLAAEQEEINLQFTHINPKYEGIFTEADLLPPSGQRIQTYAATDYLPPEEAGLLIRPLMKEREETIAVNVNVPQKENAYLEAVANEMFSIAIAHTGVPTEGDYLRWQYGGWHVGISGRGVAGDYDLTFTYTFTYYTTAAEEQQVDTAVANLLSDLNLSGKSDYEKIKAVYDYICANVRYDHEHLNDESYKHQFTAYAALFDGTAVCQGYSVLLYRLALELGIDCRFISGLGNGGAHGWNIIELDNLYYNADSTWDEGETNYSWFLKCPANFTLHTRDEEYTTSAFNNAYPMASADYVPHTHSYSTTVTAPTCTEKGYTTYSCACGDTYKADYVDPAGHSYGDWQQTQAPTEEAAGEERRDCENCDHFETRVIEKLEPSDPSGTCGENLTWVFEEETGTLTISGTGEMDPVGFDGVTGQYLQPWKDWQDRIKSVVIESGVTDVVDQAFGSCKNLETIVIPATVTKLGDFAILYCPSLKDIQVDNGNQHYCTVDGVLYSKDMTTLIKYPACRPGAEYTVPDTVTKLMHVAFDSASKLVSITLPDNITALNTDTFADCTSLKNIRLPKNLTDMEAGSIFWNCSSLESIEIPDNVQVIGSSAFAYCSNLKQVALPAGLKKLDGHAFGRCESLETITIPAGVNCLEYKIFEASGLKSIIFEGDAPNFHEETFTNITATAYYPTNNPTWTSDVMQDYGGNLTWVAVKPATSGTCGDDLTWAFNEESGKLSVSGSGDMYGADKLGWTAFAGDIRSVEIGNGATSVGAYAFSDCTNLADVQMPDSVMNIAYNAFENCSSLTTVDIPDNVMEIAYGAFMDCSALTAVDIPDSVMEISYSAFKDCTNLASVELPQNVMSISYHAFDNCTSLAAVEFPASLATIQDEAFGSCSGLDELRFTGNAPEIQSNAFYNVTSDAYYPAANTTWTEAVRQNYGGTLTWIAEGGTVTPDNSCGENITWSFEEATGTLTISGTEPMARSNGSSVMDDYDSPEDTPWYSIQDQIITIIIEDTVDSIGKNAFAGCSNLTTVIMEEGVSEIDATAFSGCDSLKNCYFAGTEEQWEDLGIDMGEATVHTESAEPETHTETKTTIAPTCTEQGYDLYTCSCGATRKDNFKAPAGHSWDNGVVTREPTANQPGIRTFTCMICKETREESIAKLESVQRVYGASRDDTALEVADQLKATLGVEKFDSMIIAVGDNDRFADALSGSYLATQKGAPILIYCWNRLSAATKEYIQNNLSENGTIYILGDTPAVPLEVEEYLLGENYNVVRLAGEDRYLTNLAILEEAGVGDKEILVATGNAFPDSLSAAATGLPIVLVNGLGSKLKAEQKEFFEKLDGNKITILGSEDAVNATIEKAIEEIVGTEVNRIAGTEREETSKLIAKEYYTEADFALVAYSWNFPDGLCGGPLAYAMKAPLLVSRKNRETLTNGYITDKEIEAGYILGSTDVIADEVARKIFGLADDAIIGTK